MLGPWKWKEGYVCTSIFVETYGSARFQLASRSECYSQSRPMPAIWLASEPRVTSSHITLSKLEELFEFRDARRNSGTKSVIGCCQSSMPPCKRKVYTVKSLEILPILNTVSTDIWSVPPALVFRLEPVKLKEKRAGD
jgi:hypothetical protein